MPFRNPEPIIIDAPVSPSRLEDASAVIFLHGLGDDGESFTDLVDQYHRANKLPFTKWVLPTAIENRDAMTRVWYLPTRLTARPLPRPELEEDEDKDGILSSCEYIGTIIDELVAEGIPLNRIAVGGFSQGCAVSLILGLCSRNAGRLGGIFGLMGYMPLIDQIDAIKEEIAPDTDVSSTPMYICRGTGDVLIPSRYHTSCLAKLRELGVRNIQDREHDIGHSLSGAVVQELGEFLESVLAGSKGG